ncbi:MAG: hypothetical protein WDN24_09235 [Sphingomonas sp.]
MLKTLAVAGALALSCTPAAAQRISQEVPLTNDTGMTITQIFISPSGEDEWGPDLLGDEVFADTIRATVTFEREEDACEWDIKATFEGGGGVVWPALDFCAISSIGLVYNVETGETTAMVE